ncbi:MAG TPA: S49 family peptidase, partial [Burkholderiaceae bacterium]|nr:S49 family peptidase [Burkholderiaceae bacterium]
SMNDPTLSSHPTLSASAPSPALHPAPSPAAPPPLTSADALEIAQTCTLAGRTDLIAEFLFAGASPAQVRSRLLAAQAAQSPEIVSRIGPNAAAQASASAADPASPDNPLIQAVKRRLALQPATRPAQA